MVVNNVEIKKGDCIIACAIEPGGYHYMLGFAFKAEDIVDGKVKCTFYDISSDDFVIGVYPEQQELGDLFFPPAYDIYVVDENEMMAYVSAIQSMDDPTEDDVWDCFTKATQNALKAIQKDCNY